MHMYDIIVIGMGPAGMAVSAMATKLGLSVLGIEKNKVGGECLNCGCIPSKALLKAGEMRSIIDNLEHYGIHPTEKPKVNDPLAIVRNKVETISGPKTMKTFDKEGIEVYNKAAISKVEQVDGEIVTHTDKGVFKTKQILVAAGRKPVVDGLKLENAGITYSKRGIPVNKKLQTNKRHIYAIGDCNGISLFSHSAMHQGMIALMNAINPTPFKKFKYSDFIVPWSVFTKPEFAEVGMSEEQAKASGIKYKVVKANYEDYGRTIADGQPEGFVKVITNGKGKIFGATVIGESASELIHEWTMAMQYKHSLFDIMMMQHSFPTISLMNKRVAENWMMELAEKPLLQKLAKAFI